MECNLCGKNDTRKILMGKDMLHATTEREFILVQCKHCGLIYIDPQPSVDELKNYYPDSYGVYSRNVSRPITGGPLFFILKTILRPVYRHWKKRTKENLKPELSEKTFLDFGCGNGVRLRKTRAAHPRWNLFGLDIDERACAAASEEGFHIYGGDISNAKYKNDAFDIVNMEHVIEHLPNPSGTLAAIYRITKIGGKLIVTTPNWGSIPARLFKSKWFHLDTPRHLFLFDKNTLVRMLEKNGFKVQSVGYDGDAKDLINHFSYFFQGKIPKSRNPLLIELLRPINAFLKKIKMSDILIVHAVKDSAYGMKTDTKD